MLRHWTHIHALSMTGRDSDSNTACFRRGTSTWRKVENKKKILSLAPLSSSYRLDGLEGMAYCTAMQDTHLSRLS